MGNIIELMREKSVKQLFTTDTMLRCFPVWKTRIDALTARKTNEQVLNLGDHLSEIFQTTSLEGRGQGVVSSGGTAWESLVCWYLNLCLIGRRTIVIRHNKQLIPKVIYDAITVNYHNFSSNTESDLIAITFPDKQEYSCDIQDISIQNENGTIVRGWHKIINALCDRDFRELEIHIIQCKTNWNDNAQIPMLWDAVYAAGNFRNGVTVGRNNYSIANIRRFSYSFVTVPTNNLDNFKTNSTCVKRVMNLTGGNYWGRETKDDIASSVKEMLSRNLLSGHADGHRTTLATELPNLGTSYAYFQL